VGRGEVLLVAVQRLQVAAEDVLGHRVVGRARAVGVAAVRQQAVDQAGGGGLVRGRRHGHLRGGVGAREQRRGGGQQEGEQCCGDSGIHAGARAGGGRWKSGVTATGTTAGAGSCRTVPWVHGDVPPQASRCGVGKGERKRRGDGARRGR